MKKVAFYTLGCKVNHYETEAMEELFEERGYEVISNKEKADIYIINTCTVTNLSDKKSRQFMRRAKKLNQDSVIAAVGCYSQVAPQEVSEIDEVDIIVGTRQRGKIVDLYEEFLVQNKKINIVEDIRAYDEFEDLHISNIKTKTRAYIKIQDGCDQFCSYCIIPYARGPVRSRPLEDITREVRGLANSGFKEVVLTGIHIASYGKDLGNLSLIDVIEEVDRIPGIERIRLSSIEPRHVDEEFLKRAIKLGKLCNHFHLSLQSGSDSVLNRMNRKYNTGQFREIVDIIRKYLPDAGITTDIIVGFPGESDKEFKETLDYIKDIHFSRTHVFKYSPRKGTSASKFKNQIHGSVKQRRSEKLIDLGNRLMESFQNKYIGKVLSVLFEEEVDGCMEGYTTNYMRVRVEASNEIEGKIMPVKIIASEKQILIGQLEDL